MPWDFRPWGCASGVNGSCNNGWIQFEICEDGLNDREYAARVFEEACMLTAYLCRTFRLDPNGSASIGGVRCPVITCHNDAAKLGLGSDHADINHWFPKILGKDMADARKRVSELMGGIEMFEGYIEKMPPRGYYLLGDGYKTETGYQPQIKQIQLFLNWAVDTKLAISGKYGNDTEKAVKKFQKKTGISVDGSWGNETLKKARTFAR
jgi:hypothetical protein